MQLFLFGTWNLAQFLKLVFVIFSSPWLCLWSSMNICSMARLVFSEHSSKWVGYDHWIIKVAVKLQFWGQLWIPATGAKRPLELYQGTKACIAWSQMDKIYPKPWSNELISVSNGLSLCLIYWNIIFVPDWTIYPLKCHHNVSPQDQWWAGGISVSAQRQELPQVPRERECQVRIQVLRWTTNRNKNCLVFV